MMSNVEEQQRLREEQAARKIQAVYRGFIYRKNESLKDLYNVCAKLIQKTWRKHVERQKIHRAKEIVALFRIRRVVKRYRQTLDSIKKQRQIHEFDAVLAYFPGNSKPPAPQPKRARGRSRVRKSVFEYSEPQTARRGTPSNNTKEQEKKKSEPIQGLVSTRRARSVTGPLFSRPTRPSSAAGKTVRRKRKVLVELPPPWHQKDPKRLSQSQQDDLLFNQKNNFAWAKKELVPLLLRNCGSMLNERDELLKRNERYCDRTVNKSFICPIPRSMRGLGLKSPKEARFIGGGCLLTVASAVASVVIEPKNITNDNTVFEAEFDTSSPLLDLAIHPFSGGIVGIDAYWNLHLFDKGKKVMSLQLTVGTAIPKVPKYLNFDKNGLLWVNLFPQKSSLLLVDPLTLQVALQISLDAVAQVHRFMRTVISLVPIHHNNVPYGFAGTFNGMTDVYLFSYDFTKSKALKHPGMKNMPQVKQCSNGRIYVWSSDKVLYAYELGEYLDATKMVGSVKLNAVPIDLACTAEPDMVYVSCDDCTVHAFLGKAIEHPLRLAKAKMDKAELAFSEILLGPMKVTKSRARLTEMAVYKFTAVPMKIAAFVFSEKLTQIAAVYQNGNMGSIWMTNDPQHVRVRDFDSFEYSNPAQSHVVASYDFNRRVSVVQKKRQKQLERMGFMSSFDGSSNAGLMNNMWNPKNDKVSLISMYMKADIRSWYPFIPEVPERELSCYEVFHFLKRTGVLSATTSTFADFLSHFAPETVKKTLPTVEMTLNPKIPVKTGGNYNSVVNLTFGPDAIKKFVDVLNPLPELGSNLGSFTIESTFVSPKTTVTTRRRWANMYKRDGLNKRLSALSTLEDMVKHELMERVQEKIDKDFRSHLLSKIQQVPAFDIHSRAPLHDSSDVKWVCQPNRNPLLDEKRHKSIYDTWAKKIRFGRDQIRQLNLRALHIPRTLFGRAQVSAHLDFIRKVSSSMKRVSSVVHSFEDLYDDTTRMVVTEDSQALPISHYLTIHSFLGGTPRLIQAVRSIMSRVLVILCQLHRAGIIVRTLCPENILLNAGNNTVTLGNVYDAQQVAKDSRSVYLPLPDEFANPSNPFLPPEYFHESPRKFTTAFDVWQFGMVLLYLITGFLPKSYGSELLSHAGESARMPKELRVTLPQHEKGALDDPQLHPRYVFFYDWLKGCPLVSSSECCVGERGECHIQTSETGKNTTILDLEFYKLLPYQNVKVNYDEARLFLEIISSCLQVDPEKRPTVEQLLRTYPFNTAGQSGEILDQYTRNPDPNIFASQFFSPVLKRIGDDTFPFAMGIISALMFYEEMSDEDQSYAFPLDAKANERVLTALFQFKFIDSIVCYIVDRITKRITHNDVNPTLTFTDEMFDIVLRFFTRFVAAVDKGAGTLLPYLDEIILSLYAVYAVNPYLRHRGVTLASSGFELSAMGARDSAAAYLFTYSKLHSLVRYTLEGSMYIRNSLQRTPEHNDNYFESFLTFSESVKTLAHALCYSIDKQRANAIKSISSLWQNGANTYVVRLFVDFRVPQKIIHCYYAESSRNDAASFICSAFRAAKSKACDPTMRLLQASINAPTVFLHCSLGLRSVQGEGMKLPSLEITRSIFCGNAVHPMLSLTVNDTLMALIDTARETSCRNLLTEAVEYASPFLIPVIMSSQTLQKNLRQNEIAYLPKIDYREISSSLTMEETIAVCKKLAATLFIRNCPVPPEVKEDQNPIQTAVDFFMRAINLTIKECDALSRRFDLRANRTQIETGTKHKETSTSAAQFSIAEMCSVLVHLFKCMCRCWFAPKSQCSSEMFAFLKRFIVQDIPFCRNMPHPYCRLHRAVHQMFIYCVEKVPSDSPVYEKIADICEIWCKVLRRDISFVVSSVSKDAGHLQIMGRYREDREIRMRMFQALVSRSFAGITPVFKLIVRDMLYNRACVKFDISVGLVHDYFHPVRSEAMDLVLFVLEKRDKFEVMAKALAHELLVSNFMDNERHLTEEDDNNYLVNSSMRLLLVVSQSAELFNEATVRSARSLLQSLKMRFSRALIDLTKFKSEPEQVIKPVTPLTVRETWKRPITTLQKKNDGFHSARIVTKPSRPVSAFAKAPLSPR